MIKRITMTDPPYTRAIRHRTAAASKLALWNEVEDMVIYVPAILPPKRPEGSKPVGMTVQDLESLSSQTDTQ